MITFDPFWKTLKDKNITQYDLIEHYKMSRGLLDNLKHNRSITLRTLNDLCNMLDCGILDIIRYEKDYVSNSDEG
ncbi:helix-turn-helix transcriptional regulator [Enterocloster asparagiformis]|uniref:helix-turn-helix domain-containing protein n=1 Tax=Enterocloster asparagiformis TaxID=333367 RepID=UPI002A7F15C2|nr:helix-turn-helix transcriptional regulator [Enterocloster asparagiformis]